MPNSLSVRLALHAGTVLLGWDPIRNSTSIVGGQTDLAARLVPITPPGQAWASAELVDLLRPAAGPVIAWDPLGPMTIPNGPTVDVFALRRSADPVPPTAGPAPAGRTVVALDLAGYSDIGRSREEEEPDGILVAAFEDEQIQGFVDQALADAKLTRRGIILANVAGDGAVLVFADAGDAHRFARALHEAARLCNADVSRPSAKRWFRTGADTGPIEVTRRPRPPRGKLAGAAVVKAIRLGAAADPGDMVISDAMYAALPNEARRQYGPEELVPGRRGRSIRAHRCTMVPTAENERDTPNPSVESVIDLFDRLNPRDQLDRLMLLLGMPAAFRPPSGLTLAARQNIILDWAAATEGGLQRLNNVLRSLIRAQVASWAPAGLAEGGKGAGDPRRAADVERLLAGLDARHLDDLVYRLGAGDDVLPLGRLAPADRGRALAAWAGSPAGPGLDRLETELRFLRARTSGVVKLKVTERLASDWHKLADYFDIPLADRGRFGHGREPQGVWEWLEVRNRLGELAAALADIRRNDLADLLRHDASPS